jgi:hypothetical protein
MTKHLTISVKMLGKKRPVLENVSIQLPDELSHQTTLSQLLDIIVRQQVTAFNDKRKNDNVLPYLDKAEIEAMKNRGKVDFGTVYNTQKADVEKAVQDALQAFEDGLYFVFIDNEKMEHLTDLVELKTNSHLLFLRLVALTGGYF